MPGIEQQAIAQSCACLGKLIRVIPAPLWVELHRYYQSPKEGDDPTLQAASIFTDQIGPDSPESMK